MLSDIISISFSLLLKRTITCRMPAGTRPCYFYYTATSNHNLEIKNHMNRTQ